jgi:asparagine synthase (glutamine-hydrolysing)
MCGVCGFISLVHPLEQEKDVLLRMMYAMQHRGPDDEGTYINQHAALGSRRLSIIDLEGGKQPITNEDETLWIVFNGEIYNFQDLRTYLIKRGHTFRTHSDTEVIVHLYEEFGSNFVQHLDGIFAIAIWDSIREELLLARDRMGIKPLYYARIDGHLIFGSELKVLLKHPLVQAEIDLISLNEYLSYEYVPSPRTIIHNVFRLEPGYVLRFSRLGIQFERYWNISLARSESRPPVNWHDYASGLDDVLANSIRRELVSDVPVGVLLSGGIDSSTVAYYMSKYYSGTVESFCVGFEESSFDESRYARQIAQRFDLQHNELILTSKMAAEVVPDIMDVLDEPFGDSSFIPTYLLSKFARKNVKVVLGGDGGDELFAGYPTMLAHRLIEYYERIVPWTVRAQIAPKIMNRMSVSFDNISFDFRMRRFLAGRGVPLQSRHHRWLGSFFDEEKVALLQDWIKPVLRDTYHEAYQHARECDALLPLNRLLYDDMKLYLEGDILFKVDRASMATSLEVRVPLLNREIVQYVSDLPLELKLHRLTGKYLLKKTMNGRLPGDILKRPKKGFNMPVAEWLTCDLKDLLLDMLSEERIVRQGYFNYGYVKQLIDDHLTRRKDNRKLLWTLLMFQMWEEKYVS